MMMLHEIGPKADLGHPPDLKEARKCFRDIKKLKDEEEQMKYELGRYYYQWDNLPPQEDFDMLAQSMWARQGLEERMEHYGFKIVKGRVVEIPPGACK